MTLIATEREYLVTEGPLQSQISIVQQQIAVDLNTDQKSLIVIQDPMANQLALTSLPQFNLEVDTGYPSPQPYGYKRTSEDYYVNLLLDFFVDVNASQNMVTIYLEEAIVLNQGRYVDIKKIDSSDNVVRVHTLNGQQMDDTQGAFWDLNLEGESVRFTSTGLGYSVT